jgi:hypothetical protein
LLDPTRITLNYLMRYELVRARTSDPRNHDIRALLVRSGNICAFPGCKHPILNERNDFIAQICHIRGASPNGPRFDADQTDEERRAFENLLILCYAHHVEIDKHLAEYTPERLLDIKVQHEANAPEFSPSSEATLQALLQPNIIHNLPVKWQSALSVRAAFRALPAIARGDDVFGSLCPREYLVAHLIGVGLVAYSLIIDSAGPGNCVANIARLIAYGAAGKMTSNSPPRGAIEAAISMARAIGSAELSVTGHYGTSVDSREAMELSVCALPESLGQLRLDLAIAAVPDEMGCEEFLLSPIWDAAEAESWQIEFEKFVNAVPIIDEDSQYLTEAMRQIAFGGMSRDDIDRYVCSWLESSDIAKRLRG